MPRKKEKSRNQVITRILSMDKNNALILIFAFVDSSRSFIEDIVFLLIFNLEAMNCNLLMFSFIAIHFRIYKIVILNY